MKKWIVLWVVFVLVLLVPCSVSADEGVVIISSDDSNTASISLADLKINTPVEIPDYGKITLTSFDFFDSIGSWGLPIKSGAEADLIGLRFDILNLSAMAVDYTQEISALAIYKDKHEFGCSTRQYDYDSSHSMTLTSGDTFEVYPFYEGHYLIYCVLPNAVIADKTGSLLINFKLGENEITYNIRK